MSSTKKERNIEVGTRLSQFRKALSLSGVQLAECIGRTRQTWAGYESGAAEPPLAVLAAIVKKYRLNLNWLLTGEGGMLGQKGGMPYAGIKLDEKDRRITELEAELKEERQLNRELTRQILKQTQDGKKNEEL